MDVLAEYYLLCTVRLGGKKHIINEITSKNMSIVFSKKEMTLYMRQHDKVYIARENVVGGGFKQEKIMVF